MTHLRNMLQKAQWLSIVLGLSLVFTLSSCSSSGGDDDGGNNNNQGNTSEATVSDNNKKDVSTASAEGAKQAVTGSTLPTGISAESELNEALKDLAINVLEQVESLSNLPTGYSGTLTGDCGGNANYNAVINGQQVNRIEYDFNQYCSSSYTLDGNMTIYYTYSGNDISSYRIVYDNLTYSGPSYNETINMTITCNASYSCTYSSTTTGSDGRTYTVSDSSVTGNNSSGYNVSATVTDPDHGTITITATNITICDNGNIGSGEIEVTDSTGAVVLSITFPNCSEMVVTYDGVATTYNQ